AFYQSNGLNHLHPPHRCLAPNTSINILRHSDVREKSFPHTSSLPQVLRVHLPYDYLKIPSTLLLWKFSPISHDILSALPSLTDLLLFHPVLGTIVTPLHKAVLDKMTAQRYKIIMDSL